MANFSDGRTANKRPVSGSMVCYAVCDLGRLGRIWDASERRSDAAARNAMRVILVATTLTACCCSVLEACAAAIAPLGLPADANERAEWQTVLSSVGRSRFLSSRAARSVALPGERGPQQRGESGGGGDEGAAAGEAE